ncbi:radical SAM protein [Frankia sp. AgB1.9]|uniref:radical SAM protein n=1 Tax=unclassified Frankia TaxID=2632575 RepID=UPI001933EA17|nr:MULTISPECIES: radical SAM protein [unclassified Frankia]MBL7491322.1 radical SAM protein [Frankia sp. AgW1.1]MBL7546600.1 radical SAM protein [Frankia sp. AgB1.9]MBL7624666.1 radical SAM protein [Frankia sp. AgB1.8]
MTVTLPDPVRAQTDPEQTRLLWLELTGRCQLTCDHCYADSSPLGDHGVMTLEDWVTVLADAAAYGVEEVCLIGGEPTLHPDFSALVDIALGYGLGVEVYTNLYALPPTVRAVLTQPGVRVATSYYAPDAAGHDTATGRAGSHARTRGFLADLAAAGVPLRVGVVAVAGDGQAAAAVDDLASLGITNVRVDRVRPFGRAAADADGQAGGCGRCGHGHAAVLPNGAVAPCVFTRAAAIGDIRAEGLAAVLLGPAFAAGVARLDRTRALAVRPRTSTGCSPDDSACGPDSEACGPDFPEVGA